MTLANTVTFEDVAICYHHTSDMVAVTERGGRHIVWFVETFTRYHTAIDDC